MKEPSDSIEKSLATRLIHHPGGRCEETGAVSFPIYQVSTFRQDTGNPNQEYEYSRSGNPTRDVLEKYIADLEGGCAGFAFASGMAAITACFMLLRPGDHVIATEGLYGGTYRALTQVFEDFDISCSFVDTGEPEQVAEAFRDNTRVLYLESPSNPLMSVCDVRRLADIAHKKNALVMFDNTFMTPWLQRPITLGADVVVHSATKFLGGHSDIIAGLAVTGTESLAKRLKFVQNATGAILGPFDSWLLMRGMKTLGVRLDRAQSSAQTIAEWLAGREEVRQVFYPGLENHPGVDVHRRQSDGPGAVLSFRVSPDVDPAAFTDNLSLWTFAVSLGAVESIATRPAGMTHASYPADLRSRLGIDDRLIRLSVGVESVEDLIADLQQAFNRARRSTKSL